MTYHLYRKNLRQIIYRGDGELTEQEEPNEETNPFPISSTKHTDLGTKEHLQGKMQNLEKIMEQFYLILNKLKDKL